MSVLVIPSGQNLVDRVLAHLEGKERDYSSSLVVFPGKRPSHFLRKALARKVGSSFVPPTVLSMDEFIDSVCDELNLGRKIETIDAVAILYDTHRKSYTPLGGQGFMTPDSFFSLGLKIYRDIEELAIEGVNPGMVREVETLLADELPEQTRGRLQSLSYFHEKFYSDIKDLGLSSRSMRYQATAAHIDEAWFKRYGKVIFAGFFALTQAEKTIFQKLSSNDKAVFLFQEGTGLREKLGNLGIAYDRPKEGAGEPDVQFYGSPDTHGQVLALGKILETRLEAGEPLDEKTAIVLPSSETLFPLLRQGLSAFTENTYNVSLGYPLHRTPVFGFLNNLMELVTSMDGDRLYIPDYMKFVLHPYTKNIYCKGKSEITRILFHSVEEELIKHRAKTFVTLAEIEGNGNLLKEVIEELPREEGVTAETLREHLKAIHKNTIERFLSFGNIGDFARKCTEILRYVFHESTARLHPLFFPFAESFITALDLIPGSLMKDMAFAERSSYFIFFKKYVMTCHTPFTGTPLRGLQILGFLETRNVKFDTVFVLDANEEVLPDTKKEETLLPFKAREILGLPTYRDRDKLTAYYFDVLLSGAKEVHIFSIENDKAEPSRFVEKLLWERQKKDKQTSPIPYVRPIQYQVKLSNNVPGPIPKTDDMIAFLRDHHYSATAVNRYLTCPLQFYYASVLGFSRKDEITGAIERDELGSFVHTILKSYFLPRRGRPLKEADLAVGEMDSLVENLFASEYGKELTGALYLLKRQVKRRMSDLLKGYYIPLLRKKTLTILETEESLGLEVDGFHLKGRLDSVEQRGDKTVIVDYKTGAGQAYLKINLEKLDVARRETWSEAIGSIQLPFYLVLYTEKKRRSIDEFNALFLLLGRSRISEDMELTLFDGSSPAEMFVPLRAVIFKLLGEIIDPRIPFSATENIRNVCPTCDFRYICGTSWVVK
ncbi:MAG TPA: PD-(D/E)XK nuclease family protein [Thermodesulfovibrionales bacterium]|nr:PD-(D/E)XK nuclease family protein [Thermodesulfovibrionales bacterium]